MSDNMDVSMYGYDDYYRDKEQAKTDLKEFRVAIQEERKRINRLLWESTDHRLEKTKEQVDMDIEDLIKESHETAVSKGFWGEKGNDHYNLGEKIALIQSELSEALEEVRSGHSVVETYYNRGVVTVTLDGNLNQQELDKTLDSLREVKGVLSIKLSNCEKPEGFSLELADAVIRIADLCGREGIDLSGAIKTKLQFNKTREKLHGRKF